MAAVMRLPRLIGRASLALIALLDLGALLLAIHAPSVATIAAAAAGPIFVVVPLVGAYVAVRRPSNPVGWIFLAAGVALAVFAFSGSYAYQVLSEGAADLPAGRAFGWVAGWSRVYTVPLVASFGVLLFPDGHLPGRRWRVVAALAAVMLTVLTAGRMFGTDLYDWPLRNPLALPWGLDAIASGVQGLGLLLMLPVAALAALSLVDRTRRARGDLEPAMRLASAGAVLIALSYLGCLVYSLSGGNAINVAAVEACTVVVLAVATFVGIVRYGLFDLRVALNRALVYGALTLVVVVLYLAFSALAGLLVGGRPISDLLAGALVAFAALPLRDRLQRSVNRLLYGDRDDPYSAISRLSDRLDAVAESNDVLPAVVRTVSESLRLPYAAVEVGGELAATSGRRGDGALEELPLTFQGERLGRLLYETRAPGERFGPADQRLLRELARHIAVAAREVLLTRDLRRSREELIRAREEERRRLRRDLHDGLGPSLAGIALGIDMARRTVRSDPVHAEQTLLDLRRATQESVTEIRRLASDLRPPALDQLGLLGALREPVARLGGDLEVPEPLPELPAAVEVAAYRIASEALTNAARHAHARDCCVRLSLNGGLRVEVEDDGIGLPARYTAGVGIESMRARAGELGGSVRLERGERSGTRVLATLPLQT
jgi:signal transduction histidine kinase